jgi:hypothetical protein
MIEFQSLVGHWHGEGVIPTDPPLRLVSDAKIERLGAFIVFSSVGEPEAVPSTVSIIGGAPDGEPQPMHYFDSRGVKRLYLTAVEGATWRIWRAPGEDWNGPDGPGFDQRFSGEISVDGATIEARWERGMGDAGEDWELDFPITYVRKRVVGTDMFAGIPVRDFANALPWYEKLIGSAPTFFATETEAVWEIGEHRWVYIEQVPERAGHAMQTIFVDDLEARVAEIAERGLAPSKRETYANGVRKVTYRDADGNETAFGPAPG